MKWFFLLILSILFSGCDLLETQEYKDKKLVQERILFEQKMHQSKEIKLKKLSLETQHELAILESKKELAEIEKAKELEKIRLQSELEKQKIIFEQEKSKVMFEQKMKEYERSDAMELKRYLVLIVALLIIVIGFFTFYYFKKKREDKLLAYNDNLKKYFHQKENDARVKIAEKMLDTISSGKLDKNQENQLISAFSGEANGKYQKQLENQTSPQQNDDEIQEVEIIEIESQPHKKD